MGDDYNGSAKGHENLMLKFTEPPPPGISPRGGRRDWVEQWTGWGVPTTTTRNDRAFERNWRRPCGERKKTKVGPRVDTKETSVHRTRTKAVPDLRDLPSHTQRDRYETGVVDLFWITHPSRGVNTQQTCVLTGNL